MALSLSGEKGTSVLLILLAGLVGYVVYSGTLLDNVGLKDYSLTQRKERIIAIQDTVKTLEAQTDSAKRELARGTVEDLRRLAGSADEQLTPVFLKLTGGAGLQEIDEDL